jgi:hypothetical protein
MKKQFNPQLVFVDAHPKIKYATTVNYELSDFEEQLLSMLAIRVDELDLTQDPETRLKQLKEIYIDIALDQEYQKILDSKRPVVEFPEWLI